MRKTAITVPALPGCVTQGENFEEALENARDVIESWVEVASRYGDAIPIEEAHSQLAVVEVAEVAPTHD